MSYQKPERRGPDMWDGMRYQVDIYENGLHKKKVARLAERSDAMLVWRQACVRHPDEQVLMRHATLVVCDSTRLEDLAEELGMVIPLRLTEQTREE
ncbi:MAG: hypothetical protein AAFQ10_03525 [Pseudomonadota bacterium]